MPAVHPSTPCAWPDWCMDQMRGSSAEDLYGMYCATIISQRLGCLP